MPDHLINGDFVAIPLKTLQSKKWRDLKGYSRSVYMTMATKYIRKGGNGRVKWSHKDLIKESGIPSTTVKRGVKELKKQEFVSVWMPGGRWHSETEYEMISKYIDGW